MAYLNLLASVPERQVVRLQRDPAALLRPSLEATASHVVAYWVRVQPLGELLGEALDGGEKLGEAFWHPLRDPVFHRPPKVRQLSRQIADAWGRAKAAPQEEWGPYSRDYPYDIREVLRAFTHAADRAECIVSALPPPADAERARRVLMPFAQGEPASDRPEEEGDAPSTGGPREAGTRWPTLSVVAAIGPAAGAVVLGGLGLCYWRYRRLLRSVPSNDHQ
jgi:hypothetical protein